MYFFPRFFSRHGAAPCVQAHVVNAYRFVCESIVAFLSSRFSPLQWAIDAGHLAIEFALDLLWFERVLADEPCGLLFMA